MKTLTIEPKVANNQQSTSLFSRLAQSATPKEPRGLTAKWITVDGKLVCNWVPVERQEKNCEE